MAHGVAKRKVPPDSRFLLVLLQRRWKAKRHEIWKDDGIEKRRQIEGCHTPTRKKGKKEIQTGEKRGKKGETRGRDSLPRKVKNLRQEKEDPHRAENQFCKTAPIQPGKGGRERVPERKYLYRENI